MATKHKTERQRIQFAFNADADSVIGGVFQYLIKSHHFSSREGKRKGVDAMIAFYKPFAYQDQPDVSEGELQTMAQDAVETLSRQIELLCNTFGVERPTTIAVDLKTEMKQVLAELLTTDSFWVHQVVPELATSNSISESLLTNGVEASFGIEIDEDALLGDLYSSAEAAA